MIRYAIIDGKKVKYYVDRHVSFIIEELEKWLNTVQTAEQIG